VEKPIATEIETETSTLEKQPHEPTPRPKLEEILQQHELWVNSGGKEGNRADLSCANLEGADLAGANLQGADLQKANLKKAVLSLADLRNALLFQANLEEADLLGAELQGASLQNAILVTATGLSVQQFAGANLSGTLLPKKITELLAIHEIDRLCKKAGWLLTVVMGFSLVTGWLIAATKDVQLIKNSSAFPISYIGEAMPIAQLYLIAPLLLLGVYAYFHFYLQRLWEGLAGLPAIFPDGRSVEQTGPRVVMALARIHSKGVGGHLSPPLFLEAIISLMLAYWLVPATLFLLWVRYLTRQDLRGTMLQVFVTIVATGLATFLPGIVGSMFRAGHLEPSLADKPP
jgi:pentapeptide repeat protein